MKNKNLVESFNNAINGIVHAIMKERNMKVHIIAAVCVLVLSLVYKITREEFIWVCLAIAIVIICELFNTAVEMIVDSMINEYDPKVRIIKDVSAGAVLVSAFVSLIVAYLVFFDRVSSALETGVGKIKQSPIHVTIIALIITIIAVFILKAVFKKGTPFQGGMPSGHSAIAFSVTTAIALWTGNMNVTIMSLVVALLLVQSRLESKIHNLFELSAGALLGILVTILLFRLFYS